MDNKCFGRKRECAARGAQPPLINSPPLKHMRNRTLKIAWFERGTKGVSFKILKCEIIKRFENFLFMEKGLKLTVGK
jgi:hypothetical protein